MIHVKLIERQMTTWVKSIATLVYNPYRPGLRKVRGANNFFFIAEVKGDICKYYSHLIEKNLYLKLQLPVWRPHVTILNGRQSISDDKLHIWKKYAGEEIEFEYNVNVEQHWKFWVLPVRSERMQQLQKELGFDFENYDFHLTIGRMM